MRSELEFTLQRVPRTNKLKLELQRTDQISACSTRVT
jgi:hypothetical protein